MLNKADTKHIGRRGALKRLGACVAATVTTASGVPTLAAAAPIYPVTSPVPDPIFALIAERDRSGKRNPASEAAERYFYAVAALNVAGDAEIVGDGKSTAELEQCEGRYLEASALVTATPATTLGGLIGKLRVLRDRDVIDEPALGLFDGIVADLERLTMGGAS